MVRATITDVTSLGRGRICIAGLVHDQVIRLSDPNPSESWVAEVGGIDPGTIVDTRWTPKGSALRPHVEDGTWIPERCTVEGRISDKELFDLLDTRASDSVRAVFGNPAFIGKNGNGAFPPRSGDTSLATIRVKTVTVALDFDKPRVRFVDAIDEWREVPLQDLVVRQHMSGCQNCKRRGAVFLTREFSGTGALLRVGLAREWQAGGLDLACWLQVNHIFFNPSQRDHFV